MHLPVLFPVFILDILLWETRQMNKIITSLKLRAGYMTCIYDLLVTHTLLHVWL